MTDEEIRTQLALGTLKQDDAHDVIKVHTDVDVLSNVLKMYPSLGNLFTPRIAEGEFTLDQVVVLAEHSSSVYAYLVLENSCWRSFSPWVMKTLIALAVKQHGTFRGGAWYLEHLVRKANDPESLMSIIEASTKKMKSRRKAIVKLYDKGYLTYKEDSNA